MILKNNSIIVRKCTEEVAEKLFKMGFEWRDKTNKVLTVPLHIFQDEDLLKELYKSGIKFYAVPLEAEIEEHYHALQTNEFLINSSFKSVTNTLRWLQLDDTPESGVEKFLMKEAHDLVQTVDFLRELSYHYIDSSQKIEDSCFVQLRKELCKYIKNPIYGSIAKMETLLYKATSTLNACYDVIYEDERFSKFMIGSIKNGTFSYYTFDSAVLSQIRKLYNEADLVIWYHSLPNFSVEV